MEQGPRVRSPESVQEQPGQAQERSSREDTAGAVTGRQRIRTGQGELGASLERDRNPREDIGLPSLADAVRAVRDAQVRLDKPALAEDDIVAVRGALSQLTVLASERVWAAFDRAAHEQDQAEVLGLRDTLVDLVEHDEELRTVLREAVAEELAQVGLRDALADQVEPDQGMLTDVLVGAAGDQVDSHIRQVAASREVAPIVAAVRMDVISGFVEETRQFLAEPVPSVTDEPSRAAWVSRAKAFLREGYALLSNIAVAAAFTLPSVQRAVLQAAHRSTAFGDQALSHLGSALPSLLAVTTVVGMVGMGIELYKNARWIAQAPEPPAQADRLRSTDPSPLEGSDADVPTSLEQDPTASS